MIRLMWRSITKSDPYRMIVLTVEYKQLLSEWPLKFLSEKKKNPQKITNVWDVRGNGYLCVCVCVFQRTTYFFCFENFTCNYLSSKKKKRITCFHSLVKIVWTINYSHVYYFMTYIFRHLFIIPDFHIVYR